jgi:hypothetical protein
MDIPISALALLALPLVDSWVIVSSDRRAVDAAGLSDTSGERPARPPPRPTARRRREPHISAPVRLRHRSRPRQDASTLEL